MVSRTERIDRKHFLELFTAGKRLHSQYAQVVYRSTPNPAFSVVVSKKVAKQAVDRNCLRRRVYGVIERLLKENPVQISGIIILKPLAARVTRLELQADVTTLLAQIEKSR